MASIKRDRERAVIQQPHAFDDVQYSRVCGAFRPDQNGKVHLYHTSHILVLIVAERLGRSAAVSFIYVALKVISFPSWAILTRIFSVGYCSSFKR